MIQRDTAFLPGVLASGVKVVRCAVSRQIITAWLSSPPRTASGRLASGKGVTRARVVGFSS